MTDREIEELQRKLTKRGFKIGGVREHCAACNVSACMVYRLTGAVGGRDILWCQACGAIKSWVRSRGDQLTEDLTFDLVTFLA